ncbi:MAG: hypothetical protein L6N94_05145 [Candidatus Methylarchaceae archaeon HK01M]|nr:hypothetical protein [Candidatus Methylarchaceae archaeon HK01M]
MKYGFYLFKGGVYKKEGLEDYLEDAGGLIIQESRTLYELVITLAIPSEEEARLYNIAKALKATLIKTPLVGTEVVVVATSMSRKHLPHPVCDIAEYLRRYGAKTSIIGLSRGGGQKGDLSPKEKRLISEYDLAIVVLGNFRYCLQECKRSLYDGLTIPSVIVGGPAQINVPSPHLYVGEIGRINHRLRRGEEIKKLEEIVESTTLIIDKKREEQSYDPPIIDPPFVMKVIKEQIPQVLEQPSATPLVLKLDGLRIKLPYEKYVDKVRKIDLEEYVTLEEVADIEKALVFDHILVRMLPESEVSLPEKCIFGRKGLSQRL